MSSLSQFAGGSSPPKLLVNAYSSGGTNSGTTTISAIAVYGNCKTSFNGNAGANTLATVLSITGSGEIDMLAAYCVDTTSRTIRLKVTIDGVVVFDSTSSAISLAGQGVFAIGAGNSTCGFAGTKVNFKSSFLVQVASSLAELDKIATAYRYFTS